MRRKFRMRGTQVRLQGGSVPGSGRRTIQLDIELDIAAEIVRLIESLGAMVCGPGVFVEFIALPPDERHYRLMRLLETNPEMSQREIARELGISLGKVNYCVRALVSKGWIKISNFTNSQKKAAYMYLLTPRGMEQKASLTVRFLRLKMQEYEALRGEIEQMQREAQSMSVRKTSKRIGSRRSV